MERKIVIVTIFTLLFAVSTARIPLHLQHDCIVDFLPSDTKKHESNEPENTRESNKDRITKVDLTPRSDFARFHAINRRFFDESRPHIRSVHARPHGYFQNPLVIPRSNNIDHEEGFRASSNRFKFRRGQHHHHHHRQHQHEHQHQHQHRVHKDNNNVSMLQRKHEAGFMKSIRKFMNHAFE